MEISRQVQDISAVKLSVCSYNGITGVFRPDTSDVFVLEEVIANRIYRRKKIGFDVEAGERWLDLGANIGAFALYCKMRKATAVCYEPEPTCFQILRMNASEFECIESAVTARIDTKIPFWCGKAPGNHSKYTAMESPNLPRHTLGELPNTHAFCLLDQQFDGVKMDIEGSEGELIDRWLLPKCEKLVMEYHSSRDKSVANLQRRLEILKSKFKVVSYPPEYDRIIAAGMNASYGGSQLTYFDRMVFAMGAK